MARNPHPKGVYRKREKLERESDLLYIYDLRMRRVQPAEILRRLNNRQMDRALAAAREIGLPEDQALEVARAATLSHQSMCRDFRTVRQRMVEGSRAIGETMVRERIDELELERQSTFLVEAEAWREWEASCQEEVRERKVTQPIEIPPPLDELGRPIGEVQRVLRPKELTKSTVNRKGEARFLDQVLRCMEMRLRISEEQFKLSALLQIAPPVDLEGLRRGDGTEAARSLAVAEIEWLYRAEARALGAEVDERRVKLLSAWAGQRHQKPAGGASATFTFTVEELPVEPAKEVRS